MLSILDTLPESVPSFGPNPTLTLQNHFSSWFDYLMPATHASFTFTLNRNSGAFSNRSNRGGPKFVSWVPIPANSVILVTPLPPGHCSISKIIKPGRPPRPNHIRLCQPAYPSTGYFHTPDTTGISTFQHFVTSTAIVATERQTGLSSGNE